MDRTQLAMYVVKSSNAVGHLGQDDEFSVLKSKLLDFLRKKRLTLAIYDIGASREFISSYTCRKQDECLTGLSFLEDIIDVGVFDSAVMFDVLYRLETDNTVSIENVFTMDELETLKGKATKLFTILKLEGNQNVEQQTT